MADKFVKQAALMLLILFLTLPLFSQKPIRITWGVYGGWSWGTGYTFRWHYRPWSDRHVLKFHLGGYAQLNFSQHIGLQLDFNYQNVIDEWTFHHPSFPHDSGENSSGFSLLGLKGVYSLPMWGSVQAFLAGGGGISWGEWYDYTGVYYHLVGNPGIRFFVGKSGSRLALTLGGSLVYLYNPEKYLSQDDFYFRLNVGIEF